MIRAVLDTNVLLAALRSRKGASFEIISRYRKREFAMLISNTVLSEYDEVLKREGPNFGLSPVNVDRLLDALCVGADSFQTSSFWKPTLPDADDEVFAQLALEGASRLSCHVQSAALPCRPAAGSAGGVAERVSSRS